MRLPASVRALLIWLLVLATSVVVIAHTRFTADMSAFLPQHPSIEQQFLVDQLKGGAVSRMLLLGIDGGSAAERARLSQELARQLRASRQFTVVRNGDAASEQRDRDILFNYRYLLSPAVTPQHFTPAELQEAISNSIDLLTSPAGMLIKKLLLRDPTGEMLELLGGYGSGGPRTADGVWVSPDMQRAILMVQTAANGSDTDAMQLAIGTIERQFSATSTAAGISSAHLLISGAPTFAVHSRATIEAEVKRFSLISTVGIVLLLLFIYRSGRLLLMGLLPVLSGILVAIAAVSLTFGTVHGITIGFGTTLIGEAVDYTIYYFIQSHTRQDGSWVKRFWPTIRLGVMTSVCGFASLLFSGFPGLAQIGLYSIAGLLTAAGVTRFVLPHLGSTQTTRDIRPLGERLMPTARHLAQWRKPFYLLALLALALLLARHDRIWQQGLSGLSPVSSAEQALDKSLRADLGAPDLRYFVVVTTPARESTLQAAEQLGQVLQPLVDKGYLAGFDTPARFLPSQTTQQARQAALPERARLQQNLQLATQKLPLRAEKLAGFVDDVERSRHLPLLSDQQLAGSSLGLAVDSLLLKRQQGWSALLPLRIPPNTDFFDPLPLEQALAASGQPGVMFVDMLSESNHLYSNYLTETIWLSLAGFAAIVLLLGLALRSPRQLLKVLLPLVLAVVLVMAGLNLTGERLSLLHLVGLLLIVAVGSNYSLFFNPHRQTSTPDPQTLASLVLANLTTVIGFGALAFSKLPILHAIGVTVAPGAVLALLLSAAFANRPNEDHA